MLRKWRGITMPWFQHQTLKRTCCAHSNHFFFFFYKYQAAHCSIIYSVCGPCFLIKLSVHIYIQVSDSLFIWDVLVCWNLYGTTLIIPKIETVERCQKSVFGVRIFTWFTCLLDLIKHNMFNILHRIYLWARQYVCSSCAFLWFLQRGELVP